MRNMTRWTALVLAVSLCLGLSACGKRETADPSATPSPSGSASPAPVDPADSLTVYVGNEPGSIDPTAVYTQDEMIMVSHFFEGLMKWAPSGRKLATGVEAAGVVPGMAERYERVEGANGAVTYTFHLRQNAKWSDGKAVTAHDFVYSWQRLLDPANGVEFASLLETVAGFDAVTAGQAQLADLALRAVDDATFEVTLERDLPWFLELCALPITAPLRQDKIEEGQSQWTYETTTYISNGPYRMRSWSHNLELVAEENPEYYETVTGPGVITFSFHADVTAAQSAFAAGSLDFVLNADPAAEKATQVPYLASYYLMFQTQKAPFDNALVRQAFTLAIDREKLVETQAPGQTPAEGLVPAGTYGPNGAAGGDWSRIGGAPWKTENDQAKAKTLLSQAGYPDGVGFPEVTYLCPDSAAQVAIGEALAQMWKDVLGVTVTVEPQAWGDFLSRSHAGEFDIARGRWVADYNDPTAFLDLWRTGAQGNDARYAESQYDGLLDRANAAADPAARMDLLVQAEDLLIGRDYALAPLYFENRTFLLGAGVTGVCYTPRGIFLFTGAKKK